MQQEETNDLKAIRIQWRLATVISLFCMLQAACAFEGRITATLTQGNQTNVLLYTVGTGQLRIEVTDTNRPHPVNIVDLKSGAVTLMFPHNRSFVKLRGSGVPAATGLAGPMTNRGGDATPTTAMPLPPGGPPPGIGPPPQTGDESGVSNLPARPPMPMMGMEKLDLKATSATTKLLGYACTRYELKQRGERLEVWATDQLLPYRPYLRNQPLRFGPRLLEEQWPELLKARKQFPLLVSLHYDHGPELFRLEVQSVKPEKITDPDAKLFQPPSDYHELQPLPF